MLHFQTPPLVLIGIPQELQDHPLKRQQRLVFIPHLLYFFPYALQQMPIPLILLEMVHPHFRSQIIPQDEYFQS